MAIRQLSIFIENKQGQLVDTVRKISDADINIRALNVADTKDFGVLRLIVSDLDHAKDVLGDGCIINITKVVAAKMDDRAGALVTILQLLSTAGINIEYIYAFTSAIPSGAYVVLRVNDVNAAESILQAGGIMTLTDADINQI